MILKMSHLIASSRSFLPINKIRYNQEDEDGHLDIFPPPSLSEDEEERLELAVAKRMAEIFEQTGLYIPCTVLDSTARE